MIEKLRKSRRDIGIFIHMISEISSRTSNLETMKKFPMFRQGFREKHRRYLRKIFFEIIISILSVAVRRCYEKENSYEKRLDSEVK